MWNGDGTLDSWRNRLGQYPTPPGLAALITRHAAGLAAPFAPDARALEPSCGTGVFLQALANFPTTAGLDKVGVEVDADLVRTARQSLGRQARVIVADFMEWVGDPDNGLFDLLVANPPYIRHHHLSPSQKTRFADVAERATGRRLSRLSGSHAYFMLAAAAQLTPGAVASWLVPAEIMEVAYGSVVREYLATDVRLERVHVFDAADQLFDDALVSSCVITYRNIPPRSGHQVLFTYGRFDVPDRHRLVTVEQLRGSQKWTRAEREPTTGVALGELITVKRGIVTGGNSFFIRHRAEFADLGVTDEFLPPILPSPRHLPIVEVEADGAGWPVGAGGLALLDCSGHVWEDLPAPVRRCLTDAPHRVRESYLVRKRSPWFQQEQREPAPIMCTYMARSGIRFVRNRSEATAANSWLMLYPKTSVSNQWLDGVWRALNDLPVSAVRAEGRVYGGGMVKIEPRELMRLVIPGTMV